MLKTTEGYMGACLICGSVEWDTSHNQLARIWIAPKGQLCASWVVIINWNSFPVQGGLVSVGWLLQLVNCWNFVENALILLKQQVLAIKLTQVENWEASDENWSIQDWICSFGWLDCYKGHFVGLLLHTHLQLLLCLCGSFSHHPWFATSVICL